MIPQILYMTGHIVAVPAMFCPFSHFWHHLLHCRYTIIFLKEHAKEIYVEVRAAYIDTMNKVSVLFFQEISSHVKLRMRPT